MKIGWGKREYSMDVPANLFGQMHMRVAEGILDPLCVTVLLLEGEDTALFISVDTEGVPNVLMDAVTEAVHEKFPDIPAEAVVMNATHSHTAMQLPDGNLETPDGFKVFPPEKTRAHVLEKILEAVGDAYENRTEGGIAYGYGYAVVGHSRRVTYCKDMSEDDPNQVAPNGHAIMYGKTNLPEFIGYEAGADHFLNVMYTFDGNDRLTGMIINVPCPSQTSENIWKMSADYWNEVRNGVAETFGEDVYVLPQCAAAGDLSPRILHYGRAQQRRMELKYGIHYERLGWKEDMQSYFLKSMTERYDIAERILTAVKEVYAWAKKDIQHDAPVRHLKKTVEIHRRTVSDEEADWCRRNVKALNALIAEAEQAGLAPDEYNRKVSKLRSYVRRNERAIERNATEEPDAKMNTVIHTVEVGDVAFTTTRFELYMDYMHRIQARSPFIQTFVIQLAGEGGASYLATKRAEANRGYSASIFCNMASSEGGQELVEETLSMLEEMKAKDAPKT